MLQQGGMKEMTVKELMSANLCFVKAEASVSEAASLMKNRGVGCIPVCDNRGCLLGLITDRDIVTRAFSAENRDFSRIPVTEIMTEDIASVTSEMNVHDAARVFSEKKVHRLPVLENSRLVGILSLSDLAKKRIFLAEVGDIMGSMAKAAL